MSAQLDRNFNNEPFTETESNAIATHKVKVLCVEDQLSERMRLSNLIEKLGYDITSCADGCEALHLLEDQVFDLVISDWHMPNKNGLDLCRAIRSGSEYGRPYFILLTARDAKADMIAGLDAGADDFVTKPYSMEEIRVRIQAGSRIVTMKADLEKQNSALKNAVEYEQELNNRIRRDLNSASMMQKALLPADGSWTNGWQTASMFMPAEVVSGDIYDCFELDKHHLGFYHLDIAGHGIPAAMLSFALSRALSPKKSDSDNVLYTIDSEENSKSIARPSEVVNRLNERFQDMGMDARFFTIVYGYIDTESGRGVLCQAGHPHPILCDTKGNVKALGNGGYPVGVFQDVEFEDVDFSMGEECSLILHSDGAPECLNRGSEPFGYDRLMNLIRNEKPGSARQGIALLENELCRWLSGDVLKDDISALIICSPRTEHGSV